MLDNDWEIKTLNGYWDEKLFFATLEENNYQVIIYYSKYERKHIPVYITLYEDKSGNEDFSTFVKAWERYCIGPVDNYNYYTSDVEIIDNKVYYKDLHSNDIFIMDVPKNSMELK